MLIISRHVMDICILYSDYIEFGFNVIILMFFLLVVLLFSFNFEINSLPWTYLIL
uniref:Uncharacterized protein n=1 Tax=Lepeophtheirus salmonis TaxID=72036 RepID=A0A0K2VJR7_LEPSM